MLRHLPLSFRNACIKIKENKLAGSNQATFVLLGPLYRVQLRPQVMARMLRDDELMNN